MIGFILANENLPFTVSIGLMLTIAIMEVIGIVMGMGVSNYLDSLFPDFDMDGDVDASHDIHLPLFSDLWSWLRADQVPMLVLIIIFLTAFGLSGYFVQSIAKHTVTYYFPWFLAIWPAFFITMPITRGCAGFLGKLIPQDETTAVSEESFIGQVATITIGTAKKGKPAEAKLYDKHGQVHYVMVEPDLEDEEVTQTEKILLVKQEGNIFKGTKNFNQSLID